MQQELLSRFKKWFWFFGVFILLILSTPFRIEAINVSFDINPPEPFVEDNVAITITATGFGTGPSQYFCIDTGNNFWNGPFIVDCDYNAATNKYDCPPQTYGAKYSNPGEYTVRWGLPQFGGMGCGNPNVIKSTTIKVKPKEIPPVSLCGNNIIDPGEDCDGADLAGKSCQDFDDPSGKKYDGGTLSCYPSGNRNECKFDLSACTSSVSPPPTPPPLPTGYDDPMTWDSIIQFIIYFTNFIFNILLGLSVLMILIGAFVMVLGGGNPLKRERAKKIIIWALIGFSVALTSRGIFELLKLILGVKPQ